MGDRRLLGRSTDLSFLYSPLFPVLTLRISIRLKGDRIETRLWGNCKMRER